MGRENTTALNAQDKFDALVGFVRGLGPVAVAFSGGVDSSLVAIAAFHAHSRKSVAFTVVSELSAKGEDRDARWVAKSIGIKCRLVKLKLLDVAALAANAPDRCYHCKKRVFGTLMELAQKDGLAKVLDGTNADDMGVYRPGLRANAELGVVSPLAMLGFGKKDIREMAREIGLPNFDRPSIPCLSTRFPYGEPLTMGKIDRVREAEDYIRALGIETFRVRDHAGLARIELGLSDLPRLAAGRMREKVVAKLTALGYNYVSLDLEGFRSGSMDKQIGT